ncbi:hypothetical protein IU438_03875 [Nocardia cyriacigeorgica]|nr:hypothetical protein [Nocardia cyriacigeorgica]
MEQLPHGEPDRGLGGHAGGGSGGRAGGCADTGGHRRQCCGHLHGEDHQLGDDHQLGVFDVVGAVVDQVGLVFQQSGQRRQSPVVVAEFLPERLDRIRALPVQCGE